MVKTIALLQQSEQRASQATKMQLQEQLKCLQVDTGGIGKKWCSRGKGWFLSTNRLLTSQLCLRGEKHCRGKNVLRSSFSIKEATTNSGNIRSMEKVMWDEQTYQQSQQS